MSTSSGYGRTYGVDHGICLHSEHRLRTVLWGWEGRAIGDDLITDITAFAKAHNSAVTFGQLSVNPTLAGVGQDQVPNVGSWGVF